VREKDPQRDFPGKRWLVNLLRATHLVGVVGVGAGVLADWPFAQWQAFAAILLASGIAIYALDAWSNPRYILQVNGLSVLAKLLVMGAFVAQRGAREWLFWGVLVFSVMVAHAPGRLRHREVFARCRRRPRRPGPGSA